MTDAPASDGAGHEQDPTWTVFVSWSGERSLAIARVLRQWLRPLVQSVDPWISPDIGAGERWQSALGSTLAKVRYGILCVTPENLGAPWLVFEAGVMARTLGETRVVPVLFGAKPADLTGPLSQFQSTVGDRDGLLKVVKELHAATRSRMPERELESLYDALWPSIEKGLRDALEAGADRGPVVRRADREILDEILETVRGLGVAPTERAVRSALDGLEAEVRRELERAEADEAELARREAPVGLASDIGALRERLERIRTARQALGAGHAMSAAMTSIVSVRDLLTAVERLESDLSVREYQTELRGGNTEWIANEMRLAARLSAFMKEELGLG